MANRSELEVPRHVFMSRLPAQEYLNLERMASAFLIETHRRSLASALVAVGSAVAERWPWGEIDITAVLDTNYGDIEEFSALKQVAMSSIHKMRAVSLKLVSTHVPSLTETIIKINFEKGAVVNLAKAPSGGLESYVSSLIAPFSLLVE